MEVMLELETIWLSQKQMATLFDVQKVAISKHLKNIYMQKELAQATVSKMETVQQEFNLPEPVDIANEIIIENIKQDCIALNGLQLN